MKVTIRLSGMRAPLIEGVDMDELPAAGDHLKVKGEKYVVRRKIFEFVEDGGFRCSVEVFKDDPRLHKFKVEGLEQG